MKPEPQGFPEFWAIWKPYARKTDGRGLARETFAKHVRSGADPKDIINGAAWFLRTLKERDREYVPLSSTWMNRGTYEDDCILEAKRLAALEQVKSPANVVQMVQPKRPPEEERAAHVERMKMKLRGNA